MKIAKSRLKEIILEELANEQVNDPTKLSTKAATTTQRRKDALARVTDTGKELSSQEAGIVNQIEQYISDLAAKPGIDLVQHRTTLERILKMLEQSIGSKTKEGDE
jgi:hypothetical protein